MDPELLTFLRVPPKDLHCDYTTELPDACVCMAQSQDPALLAAGSCEAEILVFRPDLKHQYTLPGHTGGTTTVAFTKQGGTLISTGEDGHARVWDCSSSGSGKCLTDLECEGDNVDKTPSGHTVSHAVCNQSGTLAAFAAGRTLHVIELNSIDCETNRRIFPAVPAGVIEDIRFVGENRLLVTYYGGVMLCSSEVGDQNLTLEYGTNVLSADAAPELGFVVAGCMDSCVHIWKLPAFDGSSDARAGDDKLEVLEYSCGGYMGKVTRVDFNRKGTALASMGGMQNIVWDFTGQNGPAGSIPVVTLGHTKNCTCQAWQLLADSAVLVTGGKDGRLLVYDTTEYAEPDEEGIPKFAAPIAVAPDPQPDGVTSLLWSTVDPQVIYAGHESGIVRCWRLLNNKR
eukprot:GHRR01016601.1.p1 GENE.GHRR01016601.1~~GHRR01016601.1.p1  ORF type:complete len:399 (+),score=81.72 GHRR01016601.1:1626-2822(+)